MLVLQHCDDPLTELEKLPKATQSGRDTFGCLVDGKAWVTRISTDVEAYYQTGTLFITASLTNQSVDQGIVIGALSVNLAEQEYQLLDYPEFFGKFNDHIDQCNHVTSASHVGKLNITHLDQVNFILSGTFEFEAYSTTCSKIVKVTEGRFDIHYAA